MLASSTNSAPNRFENTTRSNINAIINKQPVMVSNKIVEKQMCPASLIPSNEMHVACKFSVDKTSYYHITFQMCSRNDSDETLDLNYYQMGVCKDDLSDNTTVMKSVMCDSTVHPSHIVCDTITSICELKNNTNLVNSNFVNFKKLIF